MNSNYTTDDLLRQKLAESAAPAPDADALWADFEPILQADFLQNPTAFDPAAAAGGASLFGGLGSWAVALAVGAVLGASAMLFSEKTADLVEKTSEAAPSASVFENEKTSAAAEKVAGNEAKNGDAAAVFSKNESEKSAASSSKNEKSAASAGGFLSKKKAAEKGATAEKMSPKNGGSTAPFLKNENAASGSAAAPSPLLASRQQQIQQNLEEKNEAYLAHKAEEKVVGEDTNNGDGKVVGKGANNSSKGSKNENIERRETEVLNQKAAKKAQIEPFLPLFQPKIKLVTPSKKADQATAFSKIRQPELQKIRGRTEVMAFLGSDLERHQNQLLGRPNPNHWLNFGLGLRAPIPNSLWHARGEIWYAQIDLPTVAFSTVLHSDLDGQRITFEDTTWMHRMAGVSVNLQAERRLWGGFSLLGGLSIGYMPWVTSRETHFRQFSAMSVVAEGNIVFAFDAPLSTPDPLRKWQFGPRIGLEKTFFDHFFVGAAMTQNVIDYTKGSLFKPDLTPAPAEKRINDGYRVQRNWLAYVGYRF